MSQPELQYFVPSEFRQWYDNMSPRLLVMMDILRHTLGSRIYISKNEDSLGRELGYQDESQHNIDRWAEVRAGDFFVEHVYFKTQVSSVVEEMKRIGFTGIGVYPGTQNNSGKMQPMFHGDVRTNKAMGSPSTWGRVNGEYVSIDVALNKIPLK